MQTIARITLAIAAAAALSVAALSAAGLAIAASPDPVTSTYHDLAVTYHDRAAPKRIAVITNVHKATHDTRLAAVEKVR
jgi:hypothetical protein